MNWPSKNCVLCFLMFSLSYIVLCLRIWNHLETLCTSHSQCLLNEGVICRTVQNLHLQASNKNITQYISTIKLLENSFNLCWYVGSSLQSNICRGKAPQWAPLNINKHISHFRFKWYTVKHFASVQLRNISSPAALKT